MEGVGPAFSESVTLRTRTPTLASLSLAPRRLAAPEDPLKHDASLGQLPAPVAALLGVV